MELVRLTGQPAVLTALGVHAFQPDKRYQLLAYLAYHGDWVGRDRAAFLFWPDSDNATSRQNLRALLQRLRNLPFVPEVEATKHSLRWSVRTDVAAFAEAEARQELRGALAAYRGPLLQGLDGGDEGEFAGWLKIEREQLYSRWRAVALARLEQLGPADEAEASSLLRSLLDADPLDEEAVRAYLLTLLRCGRPAGAVRAFRELDARLRREMGMGPTSETVKVYEAAQQAPPAVEVTPPPLAPRAAATTVGAGPKPRHRRLPTPLTSFVGREVEVEEVIATLRDPACRLLSLVGPGGVGKTRLAIAVAHRLADELVDGAVYVPLDTVQTEDEALPAFAAALGLAAASTEGTWRQLEEAVAGAELVLVADDFERLRGASGLLARLLQAGPRVKLLVTTRERTGLEAEWTYHVGGLDHPHGPFTVEALPRYGAGQLLLDRARRVRPGLRFTEDDVPALKRLFDLTDGMPLAIELVASWLRAVPLADLVEEVEGDPGAITAATADTPARHGSVRAVFDQSWSRLSDVERQVMRRMSAFVGPVARQAAAFVAGANRVVLGSLVDRSLLRLGDDGRYHRHPLLLTLTRERLASRQDERLQAEQRHATYHLRFLRERTDRMRGPRPDVVLREVRSEMGELRAAMRRSLDDGRPADLVAFMRLLELELGYFQAHGHDDETLALLEAAAAAAEEAGDLDTARACAAAWATRTASGAATRPRRYLTTGGLPSWRGGAGTRGGRL